MLTFTPDAKTILTCNEGEPTSDYKRDPEGSVSLIDIGGGVASLTQKHVTTVDFRGFNERRKELDPSIRIFGPKATVAQDLEPEYVAVSPDGKTAWVVLQENNALGVIDLASQQVTALVGLGFKDHSRAGNGLDASNKDKAVRIRPWPVRGMYQPDAIAAYEAGGETYLVTANEGDSRKYSPFSEQVRVQDLKLDSKAFPNAGEVQKNSNLGRLEVTNQLGDQDGDGKFEELYAFGGRSFSIWSADGKLVYDSGDEFERILAEKHPAHFNANHDSAEADDRSDDKGPEPEGLTLGRLNGSTYAFIGLERDGGILIYDITDPERPVFENYVSTRNFDGQHALGTTGDCAPEGLLFIPAQQSPNGEPLLVVAYEMSGTTRIYRIETTGSAEQAAK